MAAEMILSIECITCVYERMFAGPEDRTCDRLNIRRTRMRPIWVGGPGLLREKFSSIFLQLRVKLIDIGHFFKEEVFQKEKEQKMNQHIGQYFLRHVFQNHLHAYLPAGNTTQFIYFSICTTIESLNEDPHTHGCLSLHAQLVLW